MMKKNMKLLAVMALLSAGYGYASSYLSQADVVAGQAQEMISNAFASMDAWIKSDLIGSAYVPVTSILPSIQDAVNNDNYLQSRVDTMTGLDGSTEQGYRIALSPENNATILPSKAYTGSLKYGLSSQSKIAQATQHMNDALDTLGKNIDSVYGMQTLKATVGRAITALTTDTTQREAFNSSALRIMVNSVKTLMLAPVKLAVQLTGRAVGGASGVVGGAAAGFGAGVNRTAQAIMSQNNVDRSLEGIAKSYATTMMHVLKGVVNTAALTAYGAAEGALVGGFVGGAVASDKTGSIFSLGQSEPQSNDSSKATENSDAVPTDPVQKAKYLYDKLTIAKQNFYAASDNSEEQDKAWDAYNTASQEYSNYVFPLKTQSNLNDQQMTEHQNYVAQQKAIAKQEAVAASNSKNNVTENNDSPKW